MIEKSSRGKNHIEIENLEDIELIDEFLGTTEVELNYTI